jgi:transposase
MDQKEKRNTEIIKMHNDGKSTREIAEAVGVSKTLVHNVINDYLKTVKEITKPTPTTGPDTMKTGKVETVTATPAKAKQSAQASTGINSGQRITNFGEFQYTGNQNEYAHKQTGQVITVKFIPAKAPEKCGHFVAI